MFKELMNKYSENSGNCKNCEHVINTIIKYIDDKKYTKYNHKLPYLGEDGDGTQFNITQCKNFDEILKKTKKFTLNSDGTQYPFYIFFTIKYDRDLFFLEFKTYD